MIKALEKMLRSVGVSVSALFKACMALWHSFTMNVFSKAESLRHYDFVVWEFSATAVFNGI